MGENLRPTEYDLYQRFVAQTHFKATSIATNVRIGYGLPVEPGAEPWFRRMVAWLSRKRIDVLAVRQDRLFIIELKERLGMSQLGQLVVYDAILEEFYRPFLDMAAPRDALVNAMQEARVTGQHALLAWNTLTPDDQRLLVAGLGLPRTLVAVAAFESPDVAFVMRQFGIEIYLVP